MGRKTNKQRIEDQLAEQLTVGELKKLLEDYPNDMIIARLGWFGEVNQIRASNVLTRREGFITGTDDWRDQNRRYIEVLDVTLPDIGEEPD